MSAVPYGRGRPYPAQSMLRARELAEAGWFPSKIRELMQGEGIPTPDLMTVKRWVNEDYNRAQLAAAREAHNRSRAKTATFRLCGARTTPSDAYRAEFVAALRREGLVDGEDIARVCRVVLGEGQPIEVESVKRENGRPTRAARWGSVKYDRLLRIGLELRTRGVTYKDIAAVFAVYENEPISAHGLRSWLTMNGAERDAAKSARMSKT